MWRPLNTFFESMEHNATLQAPADALAGLTEGRHGAVIEAARGEQLGHPLHPMLTDLPIGFWTSAWLLDLIGLAGAGRGGHHQAAQTLVGAGLLSAAPTALTGLVDVPGIESGHRRIAVVHAAANGTATVAYLASYLLRRKGRHGTGVAAGMVGAALATLGGLLGGYLAFGNDETEKEKEKENDDG